MKGLHLNDKELIYNDGSAIWDYMFENQRLPNTWADYEEVEPEMDWYDEGIEWLTDELLDGEIFSVFEDYEIYAFTSLGRHANLKKKNFKAMSLQGNTIAGNITGGAFSMSKLVKEKWNITLDYKKLPYECTKHIVTKNAAKHIQEWIKQNG